jgi:transketolase
MPTRKELANAIRVLAMDAVQQANSGHPGMPMGMADIAEVLWNDFLVHNPQDPHWINRDRFILSNGHGSLLHYSLLHLSGYALPMKEIKNFRQLHSKTPGHPEFGETPGVETTTGPLGQGLANAVGFALAEALLAKEFNTKDMTIIDHYTYVFAGDGCLMEGISHEACSLAGTLGLGKLIAFWDDNGISIDGKVDTWFSDNTPARFEAYHWHVIANVDGHDPDAIKKAITEARKETHKPTLICCKTTIAKGSVTLENSAKAHGAPLGEDEIFATRKALNWSLPPFEISDEIYQGYRQTRFEKDQKAWRQLFNRYQQAHPDQSSEFLRRINHQIPETLPHEYHQWLSKLNEKNSPLATRKASQQCLEFFASKLPELFGGSADLTGSNNTDWSGTKACAPEDLSGNYLHYGVREFGMAAIMNGLALHGGFIPYGGTFLVFSDYARNAIRLASLMQQKVIFVLTHDSIGLGEDGPTHQPIEHTASLRLIPHLSVWRPCDIVESAIAWQTAITHRGPSCLLFSRQSTAQQTRTENQLNDVAKGGYILCETNATPTLILIATGTEVALAMEAKEVLESQGHAIRVVSMPSLNVFEAQSASYKAQVLPDSIPRRIAIEAGVPDPWYRYVGPQGHIIGIPRFGYSAPAHDVMQSLGISAEAVIEVAQSLLK